MRPGVWSKGGFLGRSESLEAVLAEDRQTLKALGLTYQQLADALEAVLSRALDGRMDGYPGFRLPHSAPRFSLDNLPGPASGCLLDGRLQVFIQGWRGLHECPWDCKHDRHVWFDFLLLNRESGKQGPGQGSPSTSFGSITSSRAREAPIAPTPGS